MHKIPFFWTQTLLLIVAGTCAAFGWTDWWIWMLPGGFQLSLALWDTIEPSHLFPTSQPKIGWYWMSVLTALGLWASGVGGWVWMLPVVVYELCSAIVAFHLDHPGKRSKFLPNLKF